MTPEQQIQRAREAARLLEDTLFKAAREDVYGQLKSARNGAGTTDTHLHSQLILMEQMADRFFGYFEQIAMTGKFAQLDLDTVEKRNRQRWESMQSYTRMGRNAL